ncbi:hypothetical protein [Streptomyces sp. NPDC057253]|uniref:hypothetical protein n=1 Tax=Streptomyces sp. NPDC057253 TaxID=3346069 RepID=UPI0036354728
MAIRTAITGAALVLLATAGPMTGSAQARTDRDCRDFVFQEDAQAAFDRELADPDRPDEDPGRDDQGRDEQGRDDQGRDESQGWSQGRDDGIACEAPPRRESEPEVLLQPEIAPEVLLPPETAPEVLLQPETTTVTVATVAPTLGVQGGYGGSVGPAGFEQAIGVTLALAGAGLAGTYVVRRRRATVRRGRGAHVTDR